MSALLLYYVFWYYTFSIFSFLCKRGHYFDGYSKRTVPIEALNHFVCTSITVFPELFRLWRKQPITGRKSMDMQKRFSTRPSWSLLVCNISELWICCGPLCILQELDEFIHNVYGHRHKPGKKKSIGSVLHLILHIICMVFLLSSCSTSDKHPQRIQQKHYHQWNDLSTYVSILFAWIQQLTSLCILQNRLGNICLSKITK